METNAIIAGENVTVVVSSIAANQSFVVAFWDGNERHGIVNSVDKDFLIKTCANCGFPNTILFKHTDHANKDGLCSACVVPDSKASDGIFVEEVEDANGIHLEISPFKNRETSKKVEKESPQM